jgi:hypothetical protein
MFARGFHDLRHRFDLRSLFRMTEAETVSALREAAQGTQSHGLIEGIFGPKRILYKRVAEFSLYQAPDVYRQLARRPYSELVVCATRLAERLAAELRVKMIPTDVLIDAPPPDREVEFDVEIYFVKENVYRPLDAVSPVVETLARTQFDDYVKRVRIFANPRHAAGIARLPNLAAIISGSIADSAA